MEEILFQIVYCQVCDEINVVDDVEDHDDVVCPACKSADIVVKDVLPSTFDNFMISTNVQLWQLFGNKARNF